MVSNVSVVLGTVGMEKQKRLTVTCRAPVTKIRCAEVDGERPFTQLDVSTCNINIGNMR